MFRSGYQPSSSYTIHNHEKAGKKFNKQNIAFSVGSQGCTILLFYNTIVKLQMIDRSWTVILIEY